MRGHFFGEWEDLERKGWHMRDTRGRPQVPFLSLKRNRVRQCFPRATRLIHFKFRSTGTWAPSSPIQGPFQAVAPTIHTPYLRHLQSKHTRNKIKSPDIHLQIYFSERLWQKAKSKKQKGTEDFFFGTRNQKQKWKEQEMIFFFSKSYEKSKWSKNEVSIREKRPSQRKRPPRQKGDEVVGGFTKPRLLCKWKT